MNKKFFIFLFLFSLTSINMINSLPNDAGNKIDFTYPVNYTTLNVNNSLYWQGHTGTDGSWLTNILWTAITGEPDFYLATNPSNFYNLTSAPTYINDTWSLNYTNYYNKTEVDNNLSMYVKNNSGSFGYICQWQSAGVINNSVIYQNGSNIGIGTTSPSSLLTTAKVAGTNEVDLSGVCYVNSTSQSLEVKGSNVPQLKLTHTTGGTLNIGVTVNGLVQVSDRRIGLGNEALPGSTLSIKGNLCVGNITAYSRLAAPKGGAIIQGNTGLGTTTPETQLDLNGTLLIRANTTTQLNCNTSYEGMIYYDGILHKHKGCNGTGWYDLY